MASGLLFSPIRVGAQRLRNRVLMAPIATGYAEADGSVSERLLGFYHARGAGGAAAVIVGSALVDPIGRGIERQLAAFDDRFVAGLAALAAAVHEGGGAVWLQLTHAGRQTTSALAGGQPVAPSRLAASGPGAETPRAMARREIASVVEAFAAAAQRAAQAGFDGVELQAARGELLHQFLSSLSNRRRDRYGRDLAGRARLLLEVLRSTREAVGGELVLACQITAEDYADRGIHLEEAQHIARLLEQAGVDAVRVSAGMGPEVADAPLAAGVGEGTQAALAGGVKAALRRVPVAAGGRVLSSETAERLLREGSADLVAAGRAFLAEPHWARKIAEGRELAVIPCIGILGCLMRAGEPGTGCSVNPEAGHEHELAQAQPTTDEGRMTNGQDPALAKALRPSPVVLRRAVSRRIGILGAGLPALVAARIAAARGHDVRLWVGELPLGGLLGLRSSVPGNAEFGRVVLYYSRVLAELGLRIVDQPPHLADVDVLIDGRPGPAIVPPWATPSEEGKVWLAADVLQRDLLQLIPLGRRIAVVGDDAIAAETALFLAGWGRRPTVIAAAAGPFGDVHPMFARELRRRMDGYRIPVETGAKIVRWEPPVRQPRGRIVGRRDGKEMEVSPFHSVVLATGWVPRADLLPPGDAPAGDGSSFVVGDSTSPATLRDLTVYAMRLARRL